MKRLDQNAAVVTGSRGLGRGLVSALASATLLILSIGEASAGTTVPKLPEDLETELALSAAPSHLREHASVYLYDPAVGMVQSRSGENGYTCFAARTDIQALPMYVEYRDDLLIPICFDAIGSQTIMLAWFYAEEQRAKGVSAAHLVKALEKRVTSPAKPGVSPMISPILRTYGPDGEVGNLNLPHYMYYAPSIGNEDLGGILFSPTHPFPDNHRVYGGKQAYIVQSLGVAEKAAINAEYGEMLEKLCDARTDRAYCMDFDSINSGLRDQLSGALQSLSQSSE